jgi:hypothetical protein
MLGWYRTAIRWTDVGARAERSERKSWLIFVGSFANQFANHGDESGMRAYGLGSHHI